MKKTLKQTVPRRRVEKASRYIFKLVIADFVTLLKRSVNRIEIVSIALNVSVFDNFAATMEMRVEINEKERQEVSFIQITIPNSTR